jgi:hypothetical protein
MGSLSVHLREPGDHGRLAFHPECPVCRDERLAGALPADAIVGRRTQAVFAAGVLALSSAAPSAVLAAEPDQEQEGTAAPVEAGATDPASDPNFDPGGASTGLPFDAGPADAQAAPAPDDDASAPEPEPATNEDAPVADSGDQASTGPAGEQQAPSTTVSTSPPSPASSDAAGPEQLPTQPSAAPAPSEPEADSPARARRHHASSQRPHRTDADAPSPIVRSSAAPTPQPVVVASEPSEGTTVYVTQKSSDPSPDTQATKGRAARPGARFHVVLAGESLWSIANDVLGDDASVAQVARTVNRLWELNQDRIGTGDRDLLLIGTTLALR